MADVVATALIVYFFAIIACVILLSIYSLLLHGNIDGEFVFWASVFWFVAIPLIIWVEFFDAEFREWKHYQKWLDRKE